MTAINVKRRLLKTMAATRLRCVVARKKRIYAGQTQLISFSARHVGDHCYHTHYAPAICNPIFGPSDDGHTSPKPTSATGTQLRDLTAHCAFWRACAPENCVSTASSTTSNCKRPNCSALSPSTQHTGSLLHSERCLSYLLKLISSYCLHYRRHGPKLAPSWPTKWFVL